MNRTSSPPRGGRGASRPLSRIAGAALASALAGIFAYCALSILAGPAGLSAYKALESRKAAMEARLSELAAINERLSGEIEALISDPERAAIEARSLGYLRKGEVQLANSSSAGTAPRIGIGSVLPYAAAPALGDGTSKAIALGFALALFAALIAPGAGRGRPRERYRGRLVQSASLE